ncbi:DUF6801 domain-containing protein, partial [Actinocorallia longicatena]|uniref:DUF6801 domain-containing protein n=1 Tax=Actinocorallia longicatena TaxID=111803 RepID=UPI0031D02C35
MNAKKNRAATGVAASAVGCLALGLLGALGVAGQASAAQIDVTFKCSFPIVGEQDVKSTVSIPIPETIPVNTPSGKLPITAVSTINEDTVSGMGLVGGASLEGKGVSKATIVAPTINLSPQVPVTIDKTAVPASGEMKVTAVGSSPSLTFPQAGAGKITLTGLSLGPLTLRDSAGAPIQLVAGQDTFDAPCTLVGGGTTLADFTAGGTPTPPTPTPTPPTPTPTPPTPTPTPTPPTPTPT